MNVPSRHRLATHLPRLFSPVLLVLILAAVLAFAPTRLAAELLSYEAFDYTSGANLIGQAGGSGWSAAWTGSGGASVVISSTAATYSLGTAIYGGGNSLKVSGGSTTAAATRQIASTAFSAGGDDLYVSFVFRVTGGSGALVANRFASWSSLDDAFSATVDNTAVLNLSGKAGARVNNQTQLIDPLLNYNTSYLLVVRFGGWDGAAYRSTQTWLNPGFYDATATSTAVTATITQTAGGSTGFRGLNLRTNGLSTDVYYFDDIRVGTAWHDVVPKGAPAPTPLATRIDALKSPVSYLSDATVSAALAKADTIAAGKILRRLQTTADWTDTTKRVVDTSAKYNAAMTNTGNNNTLSLQYAQAVSDPEASAILSEELPLVAAAYRLQPAKTALKTYLESQLTEVLSWIPLQRNGWTIGTGWQAPLPAGDGVWLATGTGLQALSILLDVLPAGTLNATLEANLRQRMRDEVALVYSDWTAGIPWYVQNGGKPASNQWIVPISGMVAAACVLGDVPAAHYDYGVARLQQSFDLAGADGSLSEGYSYGLSWSSLSLLIANHYMKTRKSDARFAEGFSARFPEWAVAGLMPGEGFVNPFDFYSGQHGNLSILQNDVTQLAAFTAGSPLVWSMANIYTAPAAGFYGLLVRQNQLVSAPPPPPARQGLFTRSRLFVWRDNLAKTGSALWVRGGDPLDFHSHYDRGHVSFTVAGTPVLIEAGTPGYAAANKVTDYDSAVGHNILRINGNIYPGRVEAGLAAEAVTDLGGAVSVNLAAAYPALQTCIRDVVWTPSAVEIHDQFTAGTAVSAALTLSLATPPFASSAIQQISDREFLVTIPAATIQWGSSPAADDFHARAISVHLVGSQPFNVTVGSRPDHTLHYRKPANPHGTLEIATAAPVTALSLVTTVSSP